MRQSFKSYSFIILSLFVWVSCNSGTYADERTELKMLKRELVTAQKQLKNVQTYDLRVLRNEMNENISFVNEYEKLFIMDSVFVQHFGLYCAASKTISRVLRTDFEQLQADLKLSQQQIEHLHYDLKHDLLPKDSVAIFMKNEMAYGDELVHKASKISISVKLQLEAYDITKKPMDRYITSVKNIVNLD